MKTSRREVYEWYIKSVKGGCINVLGLRDEAKKLLLLSFSEACTLLADWERELGWSYYLVRVDVEV